MKSYRKKRNLFYDFMFSCCMLLCLAIPVTTFITYNIPVMALPGLGLAIATTVYIYNSLCYVSLTDNSLIIRHKSNDKQKTVYSFSEIDAVIFEYSFLEGWKIGIRQGYIRKDYSILLVGKHSVNHVFSSPTSIINFTSKKPSYDDTRRSGRYTKFWTVFQTLQLFIPSIL